MSQTTGLINTLKQALKIHGMSYADVARGLDLSEANIKRLFSTGSFTLERIDSICNLMQMELTDLLHMYDAERHQITHLTEVQEKELAADNKLLLVAVCVRDGWNYVDILEHYNIDPNECVRFLAKLDRLSMIDLLPKNRIRLRVSQDFRWLHNGPIQRHFQKQVIADFFKSSFSNDGQLRLFLTSHLTPSSQEVILRKLNTLAEEAAELHKEDAQRSPSKRKHTGLLLAFRPWELPAFNELKKQI